ncbi:hypothetical protein BDZ45DRAFT_411664 [Acephala macrosclerotiorum]|nr:hypothetical protein BDZ45DRAFT_411664 [Acephala macrosclerotiorum]
MHQVIKSLSNPASPNHLHLHSQLRSSKSKVFNMSKTTPLVSFLAFLCAVSASLFSEDDFATPLLKCQEPGTPAYDCHLNCAIIIGRSAAADPCTNSTFLSDYNAYLSCAGPDNENIWQYYGTTLTTYGTECGLSFTPVSNSTSPSSDCPPCNFHLRLLDLRSDYYVHGLGDKCFVFEYRDNFC